MKQVLFVGWVNQGKAPVDGETTKNQYIIAELKKYCKVTVLDFYAKNRHPWIYLQALWALISQPKATIIFSTSTKNVYAQLKAFKKLRIKRDIIHWVVGGALGKYVQEGRYQADVLNYVKYNLVQCKGMIAELESAGVTNARLVSNFKPITYYPDIEKAIAKRKSSDKLRFVFLSRIMADKGCNYIMTAVKLLNEQGYSDKFTVDFYGKVDAGYKTVFEEHVESLSNVNYYGLLNLKSKEGYDQLATYDAMLFPSFWRGEGFAGVFIDAFIAGLPVLASDWGHNADSIINGKTGLIFPVHHVEALRQVMEDCLTGKIDMNLMGKNARAEAPKYQADNVMTEAYLKSIGLI